MSLISDVSFFYSEIMRCILCYDEFIYAIKKILMDIFFNLDICIYLYIKFRVCKHTVLGVYVNVPPSLRKSH